MLLTSPLLPAQPDPNKQVSEIVTLSGENIHRWYGHAGRSYFIQVSDPISPIAKWNWLPAIEGGNDEEISHEIGGTAAKVFYRLKYTDQVPGPNETLDTADFDQDGLSNLDEIVPPPPLYATDPLDPDTDRDGLTDGYERTNGLDPNDDGSIDPNNGPNGDPDGDGLANAEEEALGTDPKESDSDDDGLGDGIDAGPTDVVISWQKTTEPKFAVIDLGIEDSDDLIFSDLSERGTVLLSKIPQAAPYRRLLVDRTREIHDLPSVPPDAGSTLPYFSTFPTTLMGDSVLGTRVIPPTPGTNEDCTWDPVSDTYTPYDVPWYIDDVLDDRREFRVERSYDFTFVEGELTIYDTLLTPQGVLAGSEWLGSNYAKVEQNGNIVCPYGYWRFDPITHTYSDIISFEALASAGSATLTQDIQNPPPGSGTTIHTWNLLPDSFGIQISKDASGFQQSSVIPKSGQHLVGQTTQGWIATNREIWANGKWRPLKQALSGTPPQDATLLGIDDTGIGVAKIEQASGPAKIVLLVPAEVVPDFNRDGMINEEDRGKVTVEKPFVFWKNDDDDGNAEPHLGDIPGTNTDCADMVVNDARDLVDFFPVQLRFKEILTALPAEKYAYRVSHPSGAFHFIEMPDVHPDSSPEAQGAGSYLKNQTMADEAMARPMLDTAGQGGELTAEYLNAAKDGMGVLLFESKFATNQFFELIISKKDNGAEITRVSRAMPVEIVDVEKMFWRANIRPAAYGQKPVAIVEPANVTFKATRKDQWFVFCHGYNVSLEDARGWNAEVFKRLHQEGSDAKFVGVTWEGNQGQVDVSLFFEKLFTPDYWRNVYNAFASSHALATTVNGLTGSSKLKTVIAGHSLGNMLVSSAICDHGLEAGQYFMFNSAVPRETYSATYVAQDRGNMRNPDWQTFPTRLWSTDWKDLFAASDGRNKLTWQGRFADISTKTTPFNYYSTGEDVAASSVTGGKPNLITVAVKGSGAWISQEMNKGLATKAAVNGFATGNWLAGGGWEFNLNHYAAFRPNPLDPPGTPLADSSAITSAQLQANPFFKPFTRLKVDNGGASPAADGIDITSAAGSAHASNYAVRAWMLAHEIPALTLPCASNPLISIAGQNMENDFKTGVWGLTEKWTHSALKEKDLTQVWKLYKNMCDTGDFRKP